MTRDPLDDLGPRDQGLAELLAHLTSEPSADELSGEYAALTMFRAARTAARVAVGTAAGTSAGAVPLVPPVPSPEPGPAHRRRRFRARVGGWLVAGATVVAFGGGFAAAGYAEVLPAPLQHVAHQILGFAGVPNPPGGSRAPTGPVATRPTTTGSAGPTAPSSPSPNPGSSGGASHSPRSSSPSPRHTSSTSPLPAPTITVTLVSPKSAHGQDLLQVSVPGARRGDIVLLETLVGGQWQVVHRHPLHRGGQTVFSVTARKISVTYRVVLPATARHRQSVSDSVTVVARQHKGGPGNG